MENFHSEIVYEAESQEEPSSSALRLLIDVLETVLLSLILFLGINAVSARIRVDGFSMEPTLHSGEFVIVNKLAYRFGEPSRGDVVVFHFPRNPEQEYIKRVVALPGDRLRVDEGQVYLNDELLDEPYIKAPPVYEDDWMVPEGEVFVLGDNRNNSSDSHNWGGVPLDFLVGKAVFVYWPPTEWGLIEQQALAAP